MKYEGKLSKNIKTDSKSCFRVPIKLKLNPDTAHPRLILSSDLTAIRPERFVQWHGVLASQGFNTGSHYWEVEVGRNTMWSVGVVKASVLRKAEFTPEPKSGAWVLWRLGEEYTTMSSPRTALPVPVKPQRLGMYLNYEAGQVTLYNADDMSHLYTFRDKLSEKLYPYFSKGCNIECMQIVHLHI
ncbi:zinc-binding protein A33-like [Leucoraja erinacea]|uniref:zinc-binding protein A33-like n=1 Tax=Leucoraja erinaceus TaxID=7782 RepID=UPI0024579456|nr:zinc-binding protein A33-like [Leucoraja erinacea]